MKLEKMNKNKFIYHFLFFIILVISCRKGVKMNKSCEIQCEDEHVWKINSIIFSLTYDLECFRWRNIDNEDEMTSQNNNSEYSSLWSNSFFISDKLSTKDDISYNIEWRNSKSYDFICDTIYPNKNWNYELPSQISFSHDGEIEILMNDGIILSGTTLHTLLFNRTGNIQFDTFLDSLCVESCYYSRYKEIRALRKVKCFL